MNYSTLPLLFAAAICAAAPALAQSHGDMLEAWGQARAALADRDKPAFQPSPAIIAGQRLADARQRLQSRAGVGSSLLKDLDVANVAVAVAPGQALPCAISTRGDRTVVSCSDSLASRDASDAALLLAERAAELRLAKMPASAEKDYMVISLATRSWIEAGGQVMSEPEMRGRMASWWDRAVSGKGSPADYAPRGATRRPSLDELIAANGAAQATVQARIDANDKTVENANCESDGQFALNARREEESQLKHLQDEAAGLQVWKKSFGSFTSEEKAWFTAWTPA